MNDLELKALETLLSLLTISVGTIVTTYSPKLKKWLDKHLDQKDAAIANDVIKGLGNIVETVVEQINQSTVADAKKNGTFNMKLAKEVKSDALAAVKSQGANLVDLGNEVLGNMDGLISSMIDQYVREHHIEGMKPKETTTAKPHQPTAGQQAIDQAKKQLAAAQQQVKAAQNKVHDAETKAQSTQPAANQGGNA